MPGEQGRTLSALTSGNVCCNYPFIWLGTTDLETPRLHNALARAATHSPGSNKKEREQEHQQRPARSTSPGTSAICLLQRWCKQLPSSSCSSWPWGLTASLLKMYHQGWDAQGRVGRRLWLQAPVLSSLLSSAPSPRPGSMTWAPT